MNTFCTKKPKLSIIERAKIELLFNQGISICKIANYLVRNKSTISREIRRYKDPSLYRAELAQHRADTCRRRSHQHCKAHNYELLAFTERNLKRKWSPEIIAAVWNKENHLFNITHTTIYAITKTIRPEWRKYLKHPRK